MKEKESLKDKLALLKDNIGEKLFNELSVEDRIFIAETEGSIDFGYPVDLDKIKKILEEKYE